MANYKFIFLLFLFVFAGCKERAKAKVDFYTVLSEKPVFPEDSWLFVNPVDLNWNLTELSEAEDFFYEIESQSVFVVHKGYVVASWGDFTKNVEARSIRKSLLGGLYGTIATLDINMTLNDLNIDDKKKLSLVDKSATIEDLLSSSSGISHPAAYSPTNRTKIDGQVLPGERFQYNNWDFNSLGTIYNQLTERDLFKDFKTKIADRINMEDFLLANTEYLFEDKSEHPAYLFDISARDLARYGYLIMNKGKWKEETIIDSNWINNSTRRHHLVPSKHRNSTNGYGYLWWTYDWKFNEKHTKQAFAARGTGGQYLFICPELETLVVFRSEPGGWFKRISGGRVKIEDSYLLLSKIFKAHPAMTN